MKNSKYIYEPVMNNKYYVSENRGYDIVKKAENGYKVKGKHNKYLYILEYGWQGYYYKDFKAFKSGKDVCYIPEYVYKKKEQYCIVVPLDKKNKSIYYRQDIIDAVSKELNSSTYKDLFKDRVPKNLIIDLAEYVFYIVDWQHPESYLYETEWDEYIENYFERNKEEVEEYASEILKKQMEEDGYSYE